MRCVIGIVIALLSFVALGRADVVSPEMEATFLNKLKSAVAQKDFKAFSALYSQSGTFDPAMKKITDMQSQNVFKTICGLTAPDFEFVPISASVPKSFQYQGKTFAPNLPPAVMVQIHDLKAAPNTAGAGSWGFPLGVDNGVLMIVQTALKP